MATAIRLLFFDFVSNFGGAQRSTLELASRLQEHCDVAVVAANQVCPQFFEEAGRAGIRISALAPGGTHKSLRVRGARRDLRRWLNDASELMRIGSELRRRVKSERPDAVWSSSRKGFVLAALALAGTRVPVVYFLRGDASGMRKRQHFVSFLKHRAARIIVLTDGIREQVARLGISRGMIGVIPNAIDAEVVAARAEGASSEILPQLHRALRILLPATLVENKGQRVAVHALPHLVQRGYDPVLYLAGDEPAAARSHFKDSLVEDARRLDVLDRLELLGWRRDIPRLIAAATVVILPSEHEGVPRVLLEAIALKKPVVATAVGGIPDLIIAGRTGRLIVRLDGPSLADGIISAIEDLALSNDRIRGFEEILDRFTPRAQVEAALREFGTLVRGPERHDG